MARFVSYQCPDCGGVFEHLHHPSDAPPPDRCPLCQSWVSSSEPPQEIFVPKAPGIRKNAYVKSVDESYRQMEAASIARSEDAADLLRDAYRDDMRAAPEGERAILDDLQKAQVDEMKSGLKITNMRDPSEMREGDSAMITPSADAAKARLTVGASAPGFQNYESRPPDHAPGVGPSNAGNAAQKMTNTWHSQNAASVIRAGTMGVHKG